LGGASSSLFDTANQAFVDSLSVGLRVSALIIVGAAVFAWRFLPARAGQHDAADAPTGIAVDDDAFAGRFAPAAGD
jgi:hypothetical protein